MIALHTVDGDTYYAWDFDPLADRWRCQTLECRDVMIFRHELARAVEVHPSQVQFRPSWDADAEDHYVLIHLYDGDEASTHESVFDWEADSWTIWDDEHNLARTTIVKEGVRLVEWVPIKEPERPEPDAWDRGGDIYDHRRPVLGARPGP